MKQVTLQTIADLAGVSKSTVSYVLSGKRRISSDVAERVRSEMKRLDYKPRDAVEVVSSASTRLVSLHIPILQNRLSEDLFYYPVSEGVMDALAQEGYSMVFSKATPASGDASFDSLLREKRVDGVIMMNPLNRDVDVKRLRDSGLPFVLIGTPEQEQSCFFVDIDAVSAAYRAATYLMAKGHQRIRTLAAPSDYIFIDQLKHGLVMAHDEYGLAFDDSLMTHNTISLEAGYRSGLEILSRPRNFTACIIQNEVVAKGFMLAMQEKGLAIPQDVAIICMGGNPAIDFMSPKVTTIDYCPYDMGFQAGKLVLEVLLKKRLRPSHVILPTRFIQGDTC